MCTQRLFVEKMHYNVRGPYSADGKGKPVPAKQGSIKQWLGVE